MIVYDHGRWGVGFVLRIQGSVFPKAFVWAVPAGMLSAAMNLSKGTIWDNDGTSSASAVVTAFGSFITILGFMVVFRSNQAWGRFWEGAALVQQVRGEWFNATSSVFAFCTKKPEKRRDVEEFQGLIVRLMSLLFGSALESLSGCKLDILDQDGISKNSIGFLEAACNGGTTEVRCEVILQWVQRAIVDGIDKGVVTIAPPILSRVFQELSRGIVNVASARKINELPFPFHYAQMLAVMLMAYTLGAAAAAAYVMETPYAAGGTTFVNVLCLWSVNYLAAEIEQPFGMDPNDLPIRAEMHRMNDLLKVLLHEQAQTPPVYTCPVNVSICAKTFSVISTPSSVVEVVQKGSSLQAGFRRSPTSGVVDNYGNVHIKPRTRKANQSKNGPGGEAVGLQISDTSSWALGYTPTGSVGLSPKVPAIQEETQSEAFASALTSSLRPEAAGGVAAVGPCSTLRSSMDSLPPSIRSQSSAPSAAAGPLGSTASAASAVPGLGGEAGTGGAAAAAGSPRLELDVDRGPPRLERDADRGAASPPAAAPERPAAGGGAEADAWAGRLQLLEGPTNRTQV